MDSIAIATPVWGALVAAMLALSPACSRPVKTLGESAGHPSQDAGDDCWMEGCLHDPPGVPGDGPGVTFAINKLYFGDTTWDGTSSSAAWADFGYDIDGLTSEKGSPNHCKANAAGNQSNVQTDGHAGIDNSFGSNIIPIFAALASDWSTVINERIADGDFTFLVRIDTLGGGSSYVDLPSSLYAGHALEDAWGNRVKPSWSGADVWPLRCELMADCRSSGTEQVESGNSSLVLFANSYVASGTWVSGDRTDIRLFFPIGAAIFELPIQRAVVTAELASGDPPTEATRGILSGIVNPDDLVRATRLILASRDAPYCVEATIESIADQMRGAADIMLDGTQDPGAYCEGISLGIGFELKAAQLGKVLDKTPDSPDPCAASVP